MPEITCKQHTMVTDIAVAIQNVIFYNITFVKNIYLIFCYLHIFHCVIQNFFQMLINCLLKFGCFN